MQDPSDLTLGVVEGDTCPLTVGEDFGTLDLEVLWVAGDSCGVISISQAPCAVLISQVGLAGNASLSVSPTPCFEPPVQGFNEDEEEQG